MSLYLRLAVMHKPAGLFAGLVLAGLLSACAGMQSSPAASDTATYERIVASPVRTDVDRQTDVRRRPVEFLQFVGARPGMRVLDVNTGGGYTTQLLALVVGDGGTILAQGEKPRPALNKRLADKPQANIVPLVSPFENPAPGETGKLDLITLILNYHDIAYLDVDRAKMNRSFFDALKPGGVLVIVDHSAKPGSGIADAKTLHRIDEATVLAEVRQAGFKLEKSGDFLRNPADTRSNMSAEPGFLSDKFALRFIKP